MIITEHLLDLQVILSYIIKGINRSFFNVILGGFGATDDTATIQLRNKDQSKVEMLMMQRF